MSASPTGTERLAVSAAANRLGLGNRQPLRLVCLRPRQPRRAAMADHRVVSARLFGRDNSAGVARCQVKIQKGGGAGCVRR